MEKKLAEARRRMGQNGGLAAGVDDLDNAMDAKDLVTYRCSYHISCKAIDDVCIDLCQLISGIDLQRSFPRT
jgi:hypothetical protein